MTLSINQKYPDVDNVENINHNQHKFEQQDELREKFINRNPLLDK